MKSQPSLELLESDVLARINAHRQAQKSSRSLPVAVLVCVTALAAGWLTGKSEPRRSQRTSSESALLADDMKLAPSSLLASNQ